MPWIRDTGDVLLDQPHWHYGIVFIDFISVFFD